MISLGSFGTGKLQEFILLLDMFNNAGITNSDLIKSQLLEHIESNNKIIVGDAIEARKTRRKQKIKALPPCPKCGEIMVNGCAIENLTRFACKGCGYSEVVE